MLQPKLKWEHAKTMRMTDRWLSTVKVESGREEFADGIVRGLRLRVSPRSKKWTVVKRVSGKLSRIPLGDYPAVPLAAARDRANEVLSAESLTVFERTLHRFSVRQSPTMKSLCDDYTDQMRARGQKSYKEYQRALVESPKSFCVFLQEKLGRDGLVSDVNTSVVADWLRAIYERAPSHSRHCRAYLHAVFEWAIKAEYDYTSPQGRKSYGVTANPVSSTPGGAKSKPRQRVLSTKELKLVWDHISEVSEPKVTKAIRTVIAMGGLRISEIVGIQASWYENGWLTLPETKNGREHSIPFTKRASLELETELTMVNETELTYFFSNQSRNDEAMPITTTGRAVSRLIKHLEIEPFQLRDIRRTMKTHLLDKEYVEEREIDIWHNHGQKSDIARKHYSWAEYRSLKQRVANQIDRFLDEYIAG